MQYLRLADLFGNTGIRTFGWVEGGYSGALTGTGVLSVQTRQTASATSSCSMKLAG